MTSPIAPSRITRQDLPKAPFNSKPPSTPLNASTCNSPGDTNTRHQANLYLPLKLREDYIVFHAGVSWENRTWDYDNWIKLFQLLTIGGHRITLIGSGGDYNFNGAATNLVGKLDFQETTEVIARAKLFIGIDSGPLHIAQAVGTPSVGIFTCALPELRTHSLKAIAAIPKVQCHGCLHRAPPPVTYMGCELRGDDYLKCLTEITPESILETIKGMLHGTTGRSAEVDGKILPHAETDSDVGAGASLQQLEGVSSAIATSAVLIQASDCLVLLESPRNSSQVGSGSPLNAIPPTASQYDVYNFDANDSLQQSIYILHLKLHPVLPSTQGAPVEFLRPFTTCMGF